MIQFVSDKIMKIVNGRGGFSEATGNEFFSKIKMNHSNISEDDPISVFKVRVRCPPECEV
jgi:hypothetical protein